MDLDDANDKDEDATLLDVVGSGREVVRRVEGADRYAVECDGGVIALHVSGATQSQGDTGDLIEVESETQLQWESPTEPPTMDVRLVTKNLRGPLRGCEIRLPASSVLVSPPEIISSNIEPMDLPGAAGGTPDSAWWEIVIARADETVPSDDVNSRPADSSAAESSANGLLTTNEEQFDEATRIVVRWVGTDRMPAPSSVRLRLQIRQFPSDATATDPWVLRIPQVTDAIGHRGQVTVHTASDHRLRWRPRMGIDAVVAKQSIATSGELVYPFRFTQTRFELPIWLSRKQQQTRLTADANLTVTRRAARVEIDIQAGGVGIDPKGLRLELGQWRLLGIKTEIQETELDITTTEGNVEWQVDTSDGKWPVSFQISAELTAAESSDSFGTLTLPRLVTTDSASVLRDVRLSLGDDRRETWLVDLAGSPALQRIPGQNESKFRFLIPESPWSLKGSFATRPLELQWTGEASAAQSSDDWVIRSQWAVTSPLDLEGRLKFSVPTLGRHYHGGDATALSTRVEPSPAASTGQQADPQGLALQGSGALEHRPDPQRWTALVDGYPATIRGPLADAEPGIEFADRDVYEIVSPYLGAGVQRVELVIEQPILPAGSMRQSSHDELLQSDRGEIHGLLAVPVPAADRVELLSPVKLTVPFGVVDSAGVLWRVLPDLDGSLGDYIESGGFQVSAGNSADTSDALDSVRQSDWTFSVIPDFPVSFVVRSRLGEEKLTEIPRAFLRSLVGKQFRHEQLIATVRGGRRVRLGLPASLQTIRVEVMLDGHPVASTRDASGLRIDLPEASERAHLLDVRIWVEELNNPWWSRTEPLIRLPVGSGLQYWQLAVPMDSHLFWASNQSGRAMHWQRDGLNVSRMPAASDSALIRWALDLDWQIGNDTSPSTTQIGSAAEFDRSRDGGDGRPDGDTRQSEVADVVPNSELRAAMRESMSNATFAVPGNRYLFFAGNVFSFAAITVSRTVLWLAVGGLVLLLATAVQWFPRLHHSLVAFLLAIALAGLLVIAPDGVVLTAQLVVISLTLVAVFYAISAVATPRGGQRALPPRSGNRDSVIKRSGSSHRRKSRGNEPVVSTQQAVAPTPTPPRSNNEADDDQQVTREFDAGHSPPDPEEEKSLMPSANPAAQDVEDTPLDGSNEVSSEDSAHVYHVTDSHSDSDSSEALR